MADFIADAEVYPESRIKDDDDWFGLIMNSERIIHRKARRRLAEYAMIASGKSVPYEVFRAAAYSTQQAKEEMDGFNISVERLEELYRQWSGD